MNKTLLVGGKLYVWENGNWTATARCRGPGALFYFQEAIIRGARGMVIADMARACYLGPGRADVGATMAIGPHGYPCRAFPFRAALNRGPFPGGNWTTLGRIDIDNVSAWQLRPCAHAERQCTRTGERRYWRFGQERLVYCRCDERGYSS